MTALDLGSTGAGAGYFPACFGRICPWPSGLDISTLGLSNHVPKTSALDLFASMDGAD
jgi:hypothetical protein